MANIANFSLIAKEEQFVANWMQEEIGKQRRPPGVWKKGGMSQQLTCRWI